MPKFQTNVQFIKEFMNWGDPMKQIFVVNGLLYYAQHVVENPTEKPMGDLIAPERWVETAKSYLAAAEARNK